MTGQQTAGGVAAAPERDLSNAWGATAFVLTNQMNLNGILSSRLIAPRRAFAKYYQDPLELTDGLPALLPAAPHKDLVAFAAVRTRTGPALLEVAVPEPLAGVTLVSAVPVRAIRAVHVPDEKQRRALAARKYTNVRAGAVKVVVSPELFDGEINAADLTGATKLDHPLPTGEVWSQVDRLRGASSAVVAAAVDVQGVTWALRVLGAHSSEEWLDGFLWDEIFTSEADLAIAAASVQVMMRSDVQQAWNPSGIVEAVRDDARLGLLPEQDRELAASNLETVTSIVSGAREFRPFATTTRGLRAAKALLLVLLRHELTEQLQWGAEETGADPLTRQAAAALTGALRGLSRESVSTRSDVVDDLTATTLSPVPLSALGLGELSVQASESADYFVLTVGGEEVARAQREIDLLALYDSLDPLRVEPVAEEVARVINDPSLVVVRVSAPSVELQSEAGAPVVAVFRGGAVVTTDVDRAALRARLQSLTTEQSSLIAEILRGHSGDAQAPQTPANEK